jgi:nucleotide-binding universal stress UspA family protein
MSMRHLLVATDFSPLADAALDRAVAIAKVHGARLTLAYAESVVDSSATGESGESAATTELAGLAVAMKEHERKELGARLDRIRGEGIEVDSAVRDGSPDEAITELAKSIGANLIVIGTHGRSGLGRLLLGSVAELIVRRATCDVLVSRGTATSGMFAKPLVATDFSTTAERALLSTMDLVGPGVPIQLVHAWQYPVGSWGLTLLGANSSAATTVRDAITRSADEQGAKLLAAHRRDGHPLTFELAEGRPSDVVSKLAEERGHDLVAIGTHGYRGFERFLLGSVAEATVRHAPCSVLIAHAPRL